jgi:hypothetical protein
MILGMAIARATLSLVNGRIKEWLSGWQSGLGCNLRLRWCRQGVDTGIAAAGCVGAATERPPVARHGCNGFSANSLEHRAAVGAAPSIHHAWVVGWSFH